MRKSRYQLSKPKYLSQPEQAELIKWIAENPSRDALMIELALATGARESELLLIKASDLSEGSVYVQGLKGSLDREIPLKPDLYNRLLTLAKGLEAGDSLFPISSRRLRQIWHDIRPVAKKFHSLRHTFGLNLYAKTRDLRLTQIALGHTNIQNTMIYAHVADGRDQLRKALL